MFTTNHLDKLELPLIRKGRMDIHHVKLSYCKFKAFKILAKNYMRVNKHSKHERPGLEEVEIMLADVAKKLLLKNPRA